MEKKDTNLRHRIKSWQLSNDMPQDKATEVLLEVSKALNKKKIKFLLLFGTALGAYRDNAFISWDWDIDIGIKIEDRDATYEALNQSSLEFLRDFEDIFTFGKHNIPVDFYCLNKKDDGRYWCYDEYSIPADQIEKKYSKIDFCGSKFNLVNDPVRYFTRLYGASWQTPIKGNHAKV